MNNKVIVVIFIILILLNFTTCKKEKAEYKAPYFIKELNLSSEEKLEDYEWFWGFIYEGYPFIEVLQRRGIDLEKIKEEGYEKLKDEKLKTKSDYLSFYGELCAKITDYKPIGHLWPIQYSQYNSIYKMYYPCQNNDIEQFDLIKNFYEAKPKMKYYKTLWHNVENLKRVQTHLIKKDRIAYIRIDSFMLTNGQANTYYNDVETFIEKVKDYKHLIIDVRRNGGGQSNLWKYIVGICSNNDYEFNQYGLYSENKYISEYLEHLFKIYPVEKI